MRFVCVNAGNPRDGADRPHCTFCTTPIGKTYARDLTTGLVYHSHICLEMHVSQSIVCIEDAARRTS